VEGELLVKFKGGPRSEAAAGLAHHRRRCQQLEANNHGGQTALP
jgi:hypothetical protein